MVDKKSLEKYEMTIGIECHVQLATKTKLFSGTDNDARDKSPNSVVSPIDFGLPGMLPVLNKEAITLAIKAGVALNSEIAKVSRFDRKHYFYPDLPKGYQTTQMYQPIIIGGFVDLPLASGQTTRVRIHHAHLEEDAGKLTHFADHSLVDLNRAGTPLIEVVSEPDMHSPEEAKSFAAELHRLMTFAGVTNGDLFHGNMRFDVNISVALKDAIELGKRAEVKNLNSFRSVEKAAEHEFLRQVELLERGEIVVQETRGWDEGTQKTISQRSKEDAQDYRYMPDADIPPIVLTDEYINNVKKTVPNLPPFYRQSWLQIGLDDTVVNALLGSKDNSQLVQRILENFGKDHARRIGLWILTLTTSASDQSEIEPTGLVAATDEQLIELSTMVEKNELSSTAAKEIFSEISKISADPRLVAEQKNLIQISDETAILSIVDAVINDPANAKPVAEIKSGNEKVIGFLVGQVMKKSAGKANPALAQKLIREML